MSARQDKPPLALVTGGGGFIGGALVRQLLGAGFKVRSLSRRSYQDLEALGVTQFAHDLSDEDGVRRAVDGCDIVFHVAALAGSFGPYEKFHRANVVGTQNVISACQAHGVRALVYTSSPSVVIGGEDIENGDESLPYPKRFMAHYPKTKAMAERLVRAAHSESLCTVALRPHAVWGPNDNHLCKRIIERGKKGKLKQVGPGGKKISTTYVTDAARAHLLAGQVALSGEGKSRIGGKAYFVHSEPPVETWRMVNDILACADLPPVKRKIPTAVAYIAGAVLEGVYTMLGKEEEPLMTRWVAKELSCAHWFDGSAAARDFGYEPQTSIEEGLAKLRASLQKPSDSFRAIE